MTKRCETSSGVVLVNLKILKHRDFLFRNKSTKFEVGSCECEKGKQNTYYFVFHEDVSLLEENTCHVLSFTTLLGKQYEYKGRGTSEDWLRVLYESILCVIYTCSDFLSNLNLCLILKLDRISVYFQ